MRLLIITQYFWPENFKINDLATELCERGHEITILTGLPNYPEGKIYSNFSNFPRDYSRYNGVDIVRAPIFPRGASKFSLLVNYLSFAVLASIWGVWKFRKKNFDAIFVFQPSPITVGIPSSILRRSKKIPVIFWVQDLWPDTLYAVGVLKNKFLLKIVGILVAYVYQRCDIILAQSKSFIAEIKKYAHESTPVIFFPNWAEFFFSTVNTTAAPEIPVLEGGFNVMFAGNIGEAQDFPAILAAAEILRGSSNIQWIIVGGGRMTDWVKSEIQKRDLQQNIKMIGRFPGERMASFFYHADALLISLKDDPILSMTLPGKVQPYLTAGKPILAMMNGEGRRAIEDSGAGLACSAGNSVELANCVLRLSTMSKEERAEMGMNAIGYGRLNFDRLTLITTLEEIISKAIQDASS